jgi:hypothetical protein
MLIKIENGEPTGNPVIEENFRQLYPNVVFPLIFTNEIVQPYGYAMYDFSQIPTLGKYEKAIEGAPAKDGYGIYRQNWVIVPMTEEEKAAVDAADVALARFVRNEKLARSDWTQLLDAPVDRATWAAYRQALRDAPQQSGFPHNVVWPETPNV